MGDLGSIPGLGRSPGKGKGYPLQYFGLEFQDCVLEFLEFHEICGPWGHKESSTSVSDFHFHVGNR